jgi:hypothetical protein
MKLTPSITKALAISYIQSGIVPFIKGDAGIGKSAIIAEIARELNLYPLDIRLASVSPTDIIGIPNFVNGRTQYQPPVEIPIEGDTVPKGYDGWLLILEELPSAPRSVMTAVYSILQERTVGLHKLHSKLRIVTSGNLLTSGAIATPMGTALRTRLGHLEMSVSKKDWLKWAEANGVHPKVTSFVEFKPSALTGKDTKGSEDTFSNSRTLHKLSDYVNKYGIENNNLKYAACGIIGEAMGVTFNAYISNYALIPSYKECMRDPHNVKIPNDPALQFVFADMLSANLTEDNIDSLIIILNSLRIVYTADALRRAIRRNRKLLKTASVVQWVIDNEDLN